MVTEAPQTLALGFYLLGQAATPTDDAFRAILGTGVVGALLILVAFASNWGLITWAPERKRLLATIDGLAAVNERYVAIHEDRTLPTLVQALSQLETVSSALTAVIAAIDRQSESNREVGRRLEALERRLP